MPDDPVAVTSRLQTALQRLDAALDELADVGGEALPLTSKARARLLSTLREARRALDNALNQSVRRS